MAIKNYLKRKITTKQNVPVSQTKNKKVYDQSFNFHENVSPKSNNSLENSIISAKTNNFSVKSDTLENKVRNIFDNDDKVFDKNSTVDENSTVFTQKTKELHDFSSNLSKNINISSENSQSFTNRNGNFDNINSVLSTKNNILNSDTKVNAKNDILNDDTKVYTKNDISAENTAFSIANFAKPNENITNLTANTINSTQNIDFSNEISATIDPSDFDFSKIQKLVADENILASKLQNNTEISNILTNNSVINHENSTFYDNAPTKTSDFSQGFSRTNAINSDATFVTNSSRLLSNDENLNFSYEKLTNQTQNSTNFSEIYKFLLEELKKEMKN